MAYWLVKSEPEAWSWQRHAAAGVEPWDGVRNHQANNHMKAMAVGDCAFFYHSGRDKSIQGVLEVVREWYPDPRDPSGRFGMVDFKALFPLTRSVALAEIKDEPGLAHIALVRHTRLSVMPIDDGAWRLICRMGGAEDADGRGGAE